MMSRGFGKSNTKSSKQANNQTKENEKSKRRDTYEI